MLVHSCVAQVLNPDRKPSINILLHVCNAAECCQQNKDLVLKNNGTICLWWIKELETH